MDFKFRKNLIFQFFSEKFLQNINLRDEKIEKNFLFHRSVIFQDPFKIYVNSRESQKIHPDLFPKIKLILVEFFLLLFVPNYKGGLLSNKWADYLVGN